MSTLEKIIEDLERIRGIKPLKRFLIVEDDEADSAFMKLILGQRGAWVETVKSAEKAIAKIGGEKCSGTCYTRIFLDLSFPVGKQGTDVLEHIRIISTNTPVAVVSGLCTIELEDKVKSLGLDFVCKQTDMEKFRRQLESYL